MAFIYTNKHEPRFLLLKRVFTKGDFWQPVSGGVIKNEKLNEAVKREVFEETGIMEIRSIMDLNYSYTFEATKNNEAIFMKDVCYGVEISDIQPIKLSSEHSKYKWCLENEVLNYLTWKNGLAAFDKLLNVIKN